MPLILGTNSIKDTGYDVDNSARFDSGSSDYLNRTPSSTSNRKTFTFSFWVKRTKLGSNDTIYNVRPDANGANRISFHSTTNTFRIALEPINKYIFTTRKFRDPSAWYHFVLAFDTTQGTAANRVKIYINGVQEGSLIKGDGGAATYPDQNTDLDINTQNVINIGRDLETSSDFIDMYLAEFVFIDGTALAPTSFGEFDEDSGIWKPIDVSGLTFGTNGFYLDFENSGSLGADVSGNGNNFTVNNLTAVDQSTDTCTNNFATWNPLVPKGTFSQGNLEWDSVASGDGCAFSTIAVSSGKWYAEIKCTGSTTSGFFVGVAPAQRLDGASAGGGSSTIGGVEYGDQKILSNGSEVVSSLPAISQNDIIGIALDMDSGTNGEVKFFKNGTAINSGTAVALPSSNSYCFTTSDFSSSGATEATANFGSPPYAISSGNTDGNGYGNFEYSVPSGYYALNTKNLAEYG